MYPSPLFGTTMFTAGVFGLLGSFVIVYSSLPSLISTQILPSWVSPETHCSGVDTGSPGMSLSWHWANGSTVSVVSGSSLAVTAHDPPVGGYDRACDVLHGLTGRHHLADAEGRDREGDRTIGEELSNVKNTFFFDRSPSG